MKSPQTMAQHLLDEIQEPLIYLADLLRAEKKQEPAADSLINVLTALLSITMDQNHFFPAGTQCTVGYNNPLAKNSQNYIKEFSKKNLRVITQNLSPEFTQDNFSKLKASLIKIAECKTLSLTPNIDKPFAVAFYREKSELTFMPFTPIQHADKFPSFQSFCKSYIHEREDDILSQAGRSISDFFGKKSMRSEMYQLIQNGNICTFRAVIEYGIKNPDSRTAKVLKNSFAINVKDHVTALNKCTQLPTVLQTLIVNYSCP